MSQLTLYGNPITIKSDNVFMEAPLVNAYFSAEELSGSIDIGLDAGHGTGIHNVIIGTRAGEDNISAYNSVLVGYEAGKNLTTANDNVFIGTEAGLTAITAADSVYVGSRAGKTSTVSSNVAIGCEAGEFNTTGSTVTNVGYRAGRNAIGGAGGVYIGYQAGAGQTAGGAAVGTNCIFIGKNAGLNNGVGQNSIGIGEGTLSAAVTGSDNTCIGGSGCGAILTGAANNNTAIGSGAGAIWTTAANSICIKNAGVAADSGVIRIGTAGTQLKNFQAGIAGITTDVAAVACLVSSTGQLGVTSSNIDKKENFQMLSEENIKQLLHSVPVRTYQYKEGHKAINAGPNIEDLRVNAALYFPDLLVKNEDGSDLGIATHYLQWLMLHDMQRMQREIDVLKGVETVIRPDYELKY